MCQWVCTMYRLLRKLTDISRVWRIHKISLIRRMWVRCKLHLTKTSVFMRDWDRLLTRVLLLTQADQRVRRTSTHLPSLHPKLRLRELRLRQLYRIHQLWWMLKRLLDLKRLWLSLARVMLLCRNLNKPLRLSRQRLKHIWLCSAIKLPQRISYLSRSFLPSSGLSGWVISRLSHSILLLPNRELVNMLMIILVTLRDVNWRLSVICLIASLTNTILSLRICLWKIWMHGINLRALLYQ